MRVWWLLMPTCEVLLTMGVLLNIEPAPTQQAFVLLLLLLLLLLLCVQPKGGSFTGDDKDFLRFKLGEHQVIPAFEEAVATMKVSRQGCGFCKMTCCIDTMG
jgi:hypothetical protein